MIARRLRVTVGIAATIAATVAVGTIGVVPASAATEDFTQPGEYAVTAPPGTTCATFVVDGAHGGAANEQVTQDGKGGPGGEVTVSVATSAGTTFSLIVGGHGGDATTTAPGEGGAHGGGDGGSGFLESVGELSGGGGGGASSVEQGSATLAVAAGGGGGGSNIPSAGIGGTGGAGGEFVVIGGLGRDGGVGGDDIYGFSKGGP